MSTVSQLMPQHRMKHTEQGTFRVLRLDPQVQKPGRVALDVRHFKEQFDIKYPMKDLDAAPAWAAAVIEKLKRYRVGIKTIQYLVEKKDPSKIDFIVIEFWTNHNVLSYDAPGSYKIPYVLYFKAFKSKSVSTEEVA